MANIGGNAVPQITRSEHVSPEHTGDNISAKKTANYNWNSSTSKWERQVAGGGRIVHEQFDYISRTLTNSTTETYTYKLGGSAGTTVATITIVYTDSTLQTISTVEKT